MLRFLLLSKLYVCDCNPQLFTSLVNWYSFYSCTRTLSNSLEASLMVIALYWWPDTSNRLIAVHSTTTTSAPEKSRAEALNDDARHQRLKALIVAASIFVIRPTNVSCGWARGPSNS